jgi:hypothetical protein
MNIPARYRTGYPRDVGAPLSPDPIDIAAWFEANCATSFALKRCRLHSGRHTARGSADEYELLEFFAPVKRETVDDL